MIYYKLIKITINISSLAKVIIDIEIKYYSLLDSIVINKKSFFSSKFWLFLCYFLSIK